MGDKEFVELGDINTGTVTRYVDDKSGEFYYVNDKTNETTWEAPADGKFEIHEDEPTPVPEPIKAGGTGGAAAASSGLLNSTTLAIMGVVSVATTLSVVLTLPMTVSCWPDDEAYYVKLVNPPSLSTSLPSMTCLWENSQDYLISGSDFMIFDGQVAAVEVTYSMPLNVTYLEEDEAWINSTQTISIPYNTELVSCLPLDFRGPDTQFCTEFFTTFPHDNMTYSVRELTMTVTNFHPEKPHPVATTSEEPCMSAKHLITLIPPPRVLDATPVVCKGATHILTLQGQYFLRHYTNISAPETNPDVVIANNVTMYPYSNSSLPVVLGNCMNFTAQQYDLAEVCETCYATFDPDIGYMANEIQTVSMRNPEPAACDQIETDEIVVVERPSFVSLNPPLICNAQGDVVITLFGADFLRVDGVDSIFQANGQALATQGEASGCAAIMNVSDMCEHDVELCTDKVLTIPQTLTSSGLAPLGYLGSDFEVNSISVVSPDTMSELSTLCFESWDVLTITPPPILTNVSYPAICLADGLQTLEYSGVFLIVSGVLPVFDLDVTVMDPTQVTVDQRLCHGDNAWFFSTALHKGSPDF
jgi:hypothetical protein